MIGKRRRFVRNSINKGVAIVILIVCVLLFRQNIQLIASNFSPVKFPQQVYTQTDQQVLQKVPVTPTPAVAKKLGTVLASTSGSCGQAWHWPCDNSKQKGNRVNGKRIDEAGNTIYFENIQFKKEPPGLEIGSGVSTSRVVTVSDNGTPNDPRDDVKKKIGFCLTNGEQFESLAMISLSQPLLPKTVQGLSTSIRPVDAEDKSYAQIDLEWLSKLTPDKFEALFCTMEKSSAEYVLRAMEIYGIKPASNQFGPDWPQQIMNKCYGRAPGVTGSKFTEDWKNDLKRDTTTFNVFVENNEFHNEVKKEFQDKMKKDGFSGIIDPGAPYIGGIAFQPKSSDTYLVKLSGSAINSQNLTNSLITPPKKTTTDLVTDKSIIDEKPSGEDSTTLLSVSGSKTQDEFERATIESAIFGGIYYIPTSEIEKGGNPSMLSYDPNKLDPKKYLCDENSRNSSCPIVRATSGCSGLANAKVSVRLRQIVLSAVNDTDRYAAATGAGKDEIARSYTRAGEYFEGQFRAPQGSIKRATVDELIYYSGKGTPACTEYVKGRMDAQTSTNIVDEDIKYIERAAKSPNYEMQQILVSPINVRYRTWALYKRDLGILLKWALGGLFGPNPEWAADEVKGEVIRPALISFKADSLYRGQPGIAAGAVESTDVKKNIDEYLNKQKIMPMAGDAHIDCQTSADTGAPEYWLCSDSKNILPKCQ